MIFDKYKRSLKTEILNGKYHEKKVPRSFSTVHLLKLCELQNVFACICVYNNIEYPQENVFIFKILF